jgi:hypothetical protein
METIYRFDPEKNKKLTESRGISFEEIISSILSGGLLDILEHTNKDRYKNQKIYVVHFDKEVYGVPCISDGKEVFLKTIFPSRNLRKQYLDK